MHTINKWLFQVWLPLVGSRNSSYIIRTVDFSPSKFSLIDIFFSHSPTLYVYRYLSLFLYILSPLLLSEYHLTSLCIHMSYCFSISTFLCLCIYLISSLYIQLLLLVVWKKKQRIQFTVIKRLRTTYKLYYTLYIDTTVLHLQQRRQHQNHIKYPFSFTISRDHDADNKTNWASMDYQAFPNVFFLSLLERRTKAVGLFHLCLIFMCKEESWILRFNRQRVLALGSKNKL